MIPLSLFDEALTSADVEPVEPAQMTEDWVIRSIPFSPWLDEDYLFGTYGWWLND